MWCSPGNLPFVFSQTIIMHGMHVDAHTWDNILKETVLWVTIMWSEMEKQNIEAKKVYWLSI